MFIYGKKYLCPVKTIYDMKMYIYVYVFMCIYMCVCVYTYICVVHVYIAHLKPSGSSSKQNSHSKHSKVQFSEGGLWDCRKFYPFSWWLLFSCWVVSSSLQPHGLQCTRLPYPSLSPRVCSNSCSLTRYHSFNLILPLCWQLRLLSASYARPILRLEYVSV